MAEYQYIDRSMRIFISSTFQDMEEERKELITKVFPILKKKAAKRGVTVTELDLRWGITQEESENGKVLEICLNEIDKSRPFFIGILGDRYGWCPSQEEIGKNHNIEERYGWVKDCVEQGKSVTEMEMQYGALKSKLYSDQPIDAFFWIKKDSDETDERLRALKQMVKENAEHPCHEYTSPENLGQQVLEAFERILEEHFPEKELSALEIFRQDVALYIRTHNKLYIPIEENVQRLERFLNDDNERYIAIVGDVGSGKSALLSNWVAEKSLNDADRVWVSCYIQSNITASDLDSTLEFLTDEICQKCNLPTENTAFGQEDAKEKFITTYNKAVASQPIVLVIGGVDGLEVHKDEKLLNWLPQVPECSKLVITSIEDDETIRSWKRKSHELWNILPLTDVAQRDYIRLYLQQYGKKLTQKQTERLVSSPIISKPSVLKAILNVLKDVGKYEELDAWIEKMVAIESEGKLYNLIIDNAISTYGESVTMDVLSALWISRYGLTEDRFLKFSNTTPLILSQILCSFDDFLKNKNGLITIENPIFANAMANRIGEKEDDIRYRLGETISELNEKYMIDILEQYYQLYELSLFEGLGVLFQEYDVLTFLLENDKPMFPVYWSKIKELGQPVEKYLKPRFLDKVNDEEKSACIFRISQAFFDIGEWQVCAKLSYRLKRLASFHLMFKKHHDYSNWALYNALAVYYIGMSYQNLRLWKKALRTMRKTLACCRELPGLESLYQGVKLNYIQVASILGNTNEVNLILNKDENFVEDADQAWLFESKYFLCLKQGNEDQAKEYFLKAVDLYEKVIIDFPDRRYNYGGMLTSCLFIYYNALEEGLGWSLRAHEIYNKIYGVDLRVHKSHLACSSSLVGILYFWLGDEEKAKSYFEDSLVYCEAENELDEIDKENILSCYMRMIVATENGADLPAREIINRLYSLQFDFSNYLGLSFQGCSMADVFLVDGVQYLRENNVDMAIEMLEKSIAEFEKENGCKSPNYASACDNLGRAMMRKQNWEQALEYINLAIQLFKQREQSNVDIYIIGATNAKIFCLLNLGEFTAADFHIQKNFNKLSSIGKSDTWVYHKEKAALYEATAIYYQLTQKPAEAIQQLDEAIKEASIIGNEQFISSFQQRKKEIQESMKQ